MSNFKLEVFIGGGYQFQKDDSIAVVLIPIASDIYIPCYKGPQEFNSIYHAGTYVADFLDFYNQYIIKKECPKFVVEIHLNKQSNKKTFYGEEAIKALDKIHENYSPELREF